MSTPDERDAGAPLAPALPDNEPPDRGGLAPTGAERLLVPLRKLCGRMPHVPWTSVLNVLDPRTVRVRRPLPDMSALREAEGMRLVRFGKRRRFWLPDLCTLDEDLWFEYLSVVWEHPANGHYYLRYCSRFAPGAVVMDGGAFCGFFARLALERGAGIIVAVEPDPLMIRCLRRTFADECAAGRVCIIEGALSQSACRLTFHRDAHRPYAGRVGARGADRPVQALTIDDICRDTNAARLDFLKMDVEGFEVQALLGGAETLQRHHPRAAVAAYHRRTDFERIRALLHSYGYRRLRGCGLSRRGDTHADGLRAVMLHARR